MKKPKPANRLNIKIFADGAELESMIALAREPFIKGLTTNPTLMKKAGVTDYTAFAKEVLKHITHKPISFEVFSDDFKEMERQVKEMTAALSSKTPAIISVFAGRIADTGYDPLPIMKEAKAITKQKPNIELLGASPRQLYDIYNAEAAGADIITVTPDILKKLDKVGYDHHALSLDTVKMFYDDGQKVGYQLY